MLGFFNWFGIFLTNNVFLAKFQLDVKTAKKAILNGVFPTHFSHSSIFCICDYMFLVFVGFRKTDEDLLQESAAGS